MRRALFVTIACCFLVACGVSQTPIKYTPNAAAVSHPSKTIVALVQASAKPGWLVRPKLSSLALSISFLAPGPVTGTAVLRFDRLQRISLSRTSYGFRVTVVHRDFPVFYWTFSNLEDAERFADCAAALHKAAAA